MCRALLPCDAETDGSGVSPYSHVYQLSPTLCGVNVGFLQQGETDNTWFNTVSQQYRQMIRPDNENQSF